MNVSRRDSNAVQRGLGLLTLIFFALAFERLINATMAGSQVGTRTAWMLSAAFGLTGIVLLGLLLLMGAGRSDHNNADASASPERREK